MTQCPKRLVADGYDRMADAYLDRFGNSSVRQRWLHRLIENLPPTGGRVLDLGCGAGIPVARDLTLRGHAVVGVDGSAEQIIRARRNVPDAVFIHADMCDFDPEPDLFDAVGAFYSITHVPATEQGQLFAKITRWLKPGGTLVASLGTGPGGDWTGEWMKTTMYFSHNSAEQNLEHLRNAGLVVRQSAIERQDNEDASFLWIVARKSSENAA